MKVKKPYGSIEESVESQLNSSKHFEGGKLPLDISALAKRMKKIDPDGEKALKIAKKYRRKGD